MSNECLEYIRRSFFDFGVEAPAVAVHGHHSREVLDTDDPEGLGHTQLILLIYVHDLLHRVRYEGGSPANGVQIDRFVILAGL